MAGLPIALVMLAQAASANTAAPATPAPPPATEQRVCSNSSKDPKAL